MCCIRLSPQTIQEEGGGGGGQSDEWNKHKKEKEKGRSRRNSLVDLIPPIFRKEKNSVYHQQVVTMNEIAEECKTNV